MAEPSELKKAGLKATVPRLRILSVLEDNRDSHVSAEDVYRALLDAGEDVGLATVYRVLTQFEAAGLVRRLNFEEGRAMFELESGEHHDHLVCIDCGVVVEFLDTLIERRQQEVAESHGFDFEDHSLVLYGRCSQCQGRGGRSRRREAAR